ncbi:MAG: DJ-1/PfpI family protein [Candidatus Micrarchaeaceae archaeon]
MKFLVFVAPKDFKDESVEMVKMFLDRWKIESRLSSYSKKDCVGYHGAIYPLDVNTNKVDPSDYDGIVLIDGKGIDSYRLFEFRPLLDLLVQFDNSRKFICAIGNATRILARANIIKGKKIAKPGDEETRRAVVLFHGVPAEESFAISDNIITISGYENIEEAMPKMLERIGVK